MTNEEIRRRWGLNTFGAWLVQQNVFFRAVVWILVFPGFVLVGFIHGAIGGIAGGIWDYRLDLEDSNDIAAILKEE